MDIVFFGQHSIDWMNVLNKRLIKHFKKYKTIEKIKNVYSIKKLNNLNLSKIYIIPLLESHMIELHNNNIKAIMPSLEHIKMFSCKKMFNLYVKKNNLENYVPKTYDIDDIITTDKLYIIKPYNLNNGKNMFIKKQLEQTDFINNIIQEYIPNNVEYTAHIVSKNGQIIKCITYAYKFDSSQHIKVYPINTKNIIKFELDKKYISQLELFLTNCGYTGISNVDFIISDDQIKVFEINPRLGGSLVRSNSIDLVEILYEMIKLNL